MASFDQSAINNNIDNKASLKLMIKAANQKYEDFIIENSELDWSIKQLKEYLNLNYPKNPCSQSIRLIYSGKLLHDHFTLKDCLRHNSESTSHIIHLVHSSNHQKTNIDKLNDDNELDELTPGSTSNSETTSTSSSSSISTSSNSTPNITNNFNHRLQADLNSLYQQQQQNQHQERQQNQTLTQKEQYERVLQNLTNYYQSLGVPVQTNPWYSTYIQHMALYNHMYSNYVNSFGLPNVTQTQTNLEYATNNETIQPQQQDTNRQVVEEQVEPQQQQAVNEQIAAQPQVRNNINNNNEINGEREDDWLGILHNIVSFVVLLSIVYYYWSLERFLVVFSVVILLVCYHNGWLELQRRRVNIPVNRREEPRRNNQNADVNMRNNNENNNQEENLGDLSVNRDEQQQQLQQPNLFRLITTFILTFFTSLIPERPRVLN